MFSILILGWSGAISSKALLGVMRKMGQNHTEDELNSLNGSWSIGQLFEDMFCESFSSSILDFDILILSRFISLLVIICVFYREAFKIFDPDKDGFISTKELNGVTNMLGTMLTKEEVEDIMAEADLVR